MKKITLIIIAVLSIMSCQKNLDINTDPNNASTATPKLVMPSAQFQLGSVVGNTWSFIGSMWAQYWTGGYGVSTSQLEYYNMTSSDVQGSWTNTYARVLNDLQFLVKSGEPVYGGIGKILQAYTYQMLTDLYGAIPMSEALKGAVEDGGIISPKYDTEQEVYDQVLALINAGISDINTPGATAPGAEDIIYGGNIAKWETFANTLKLKVLVRKGDYPAAKALIASSTLISSSADECKLRYFETAQNTNPIFARFMSRVGVGMYYVGTQSSYLYLNGTSDPRLTAIYTPGSGNQGVFSGDINDNSALYPSGGSNSRFHRPNTATVFNALVPVFFISAWESKFLQAEALTRVDATDANAETAFNDAIQASFDYYSLGSAAVFTSSLSFATGSQDDKLNLIGKQKWVAMNSLQNIEGWIETVRFDRPGNRIFTDPTTGIFTSPINNSLGNKFPSSFVYPTQEISFNPNTPTGRSVTSTRFWDN